MRKLPLLAVLALALSLGCARAEDAKTLFNTKCAMCHGKDGAGNTKPGQKLGIRDYSDPKIQSQLKDPEIIKAIKEGVTKNGKLLMKGSADKFSDDEIKALAAYFRTLKK